MKHDWVMFEHYLHNMLSHFKNHHVIEILQVSSKVNLQ